jgi:hypothetical protein
MSRAALFPMPALVLSAGWFAMTIARIAGEKAELT